MTDDASTIYVCFQKDDEGGVDSLRVGRTPDEAEKIITDPDNEASDSKATEEANSLADKEDKSSKEDPPSVGRICYALIQSLDESLSPYHSAIELTTLFRFGLRKVGMQSQIYSAIAVSSPLINSRNGYETYEIDSTKFDMLSKNLK